MNFDMLFNLSNSLALLGWLVLVLLPRWHRQLIPIVQRLVPGLLSLAYCGLIVSFWGSAEGGFSSLAAVRELFASDALLLAGWLHYLAFDLLIGAWEAEQARQLDIPHWLLLPCLLLTFLFGPAGWLLFVAIRSKYHPSTNKDAIA